jgi:predicted cupin superfamily sugar epimerase
MHPDALSLVDRLRLRPHPEGGFYREVFRSAQRVSTPRGERSALTVIHYLLPAGSISAFHRVQSDEVWTHGGGDPLDVHLLGGTVDHEFFRLGAGAATEVVVPAGTWQAARPVGTRYALATCAVAPGFEFADFELADGRLRGSNPALAGLIQELLRPGG